jgi:hypothetical protein
VRGDYQQDPATANSPSVTRPFTEVPLGAALSLSVGSNGAVPGVLFTPTPSLVSYDFDGGIPVGVPTLLSARLFDGTGFNRFRLNAGGGSVELPADVSIALDEGGTFEIQSNALQFDGAVRSASGRVTLASGRSGVKLGELSLGPTAVIDVRGSWVNDSRAANRGVAGRATRFIDGGSVALSSQGDLILAAGSSVDVTAGAWVRADSSVETGSAGAISLTSQLPNDNAPTRLDIQGRLAGFGFTQGGSLTLQGGAFTIDDFATLPVALEGLRVTLRPDFFLDGGFGDIRLVADRGTIEITDGTSLVIKPETLHLSPGFDLQPTGSDLFAFSDLRLAPEHLRGQSSFVARVRRAPAVAAEDGLIRVGHGATVETEIGGAIDMLADSNIVIEGALRSRGGDVSLAVSAPSVLNETGYDPRQGIRLSPSGSIDVSGAARVFTNAAGVTSGPVLAGGNVTLRADRGFILAAQGSQIDVSGIATIVDLPATAGRPLEPQFVVSDAGTILVDVAEGGFLSGQILARSGGGQAADGSLRVIVDGNRRDPQFNVPLDPTLPQFPSNRREIVLGDSIVGSFPPGAAVPDNLAGRLFLSPDALAESQLDLIQLSAAPLQSAGGTVVIAGEIRLDGDVQLRADRRIALDAGILSSTGGIAVIDAPSVALGPVQDTFRVRAEASLSGAGSLRVAADQLDLYGTLTLNGFRVGGSPAVTLQSSGDLRMIGVRFAGDPGRETTGSLTSAASVMLTAAQIFPSTLTNFTLAVSDPNGLIAIEGGASESSPLPLSAAGSLRLSASDITQGGTLRAPFGAISLDATRSLTLRDRSETSVSGAGLLVPFGTSEFGETWIYPFPDAIRIVDGAPEKRISLDAPDVVVEAGSLVDISGGGDLFNFEFISGPGGSRDILLGNNPEGAFAILPALGAGYGVFDPLESPRAGIETGSTIVLSSAGDLPAGEYAILPARYALLPGAYLVTPVDGYDDISPAAPPQFLPDNRTPVASGKLAFAGVDTQAPRWSGYAIETAADVRRRAEYQVGLASKEFASFGRNVPGDAGALVIDAGRAVKLDGQLAANAVNGRAALVDFAGQSLAVVAALTGAPGRVELLDSDLSNFSAASILLGGTRSRDAEGVTLSVSAETVRIDAGARVSAPEVVLAARDRISVASGAQISTTGETADSGGADTVRVEGDGAILRASVDPLVAFERSGATGQRGDVLIEEGAAVSASGSISLEGSRDVRSAGELDVQGGALSFSASLISLGDAQVTQGLVLSAADLARFDANELRLDSRSTIDIFGSVDTALDTFVLFAAGLRGFDNDGSVATLGAQSITLGNPFARAAMVAGNGSGSLLLDAARIDLVDGSFDISGFGKATLRTSDGIFLDGSGSLRVRSDLDIVSPVLAAARGIDYSLSSDALLSSRPLEQTATTLRATGLGARLAILARGITVDNAIDLPSGLLSLSASESPGILLQGNASIDVGGRDTVFGDLSAGSPGGSVLLVAERGSVSIAAGAGVSVAGASAGGRAGTIDIRARNGSLDVSPAALLAGSGATGSRGGAFAAEAESLSGTFGALNSVLAAGGFTERIELALRSGSVSIEAPDIVRAREFTLKLEDGSATIGCHILAASRSGGAVRIDASGDVRMLASGRIDAFATDNDTPGGQVELGTRAGRLVVNAGAIDVSGRTSSGAPLDGGVVKLSAPRIDTSGVALDVDSAVFRGASRINVEATRVYASQTLDAGLIATIANDTATYMGNAPAIKAALGVDQDPRVRLMPGIEIASPTDLRVQTDLDLFSWRYDGSAGALTLRAAANLFIDRSVSDGFLAAEIFPGYPRDVVQSGVSWDLRLRSGTGDVRVGSNAVVRTGTGSIDVSAGRDLVFGSGTSAIYTAGENRGTGAIDGEAAEVLLRGDFVRNGGAVRVAVARDVIGRSDSLMPDFMPRIAGEFVFYRPGEVFPFASAIDATKFRQGIGTLGGGDVTIRAGGIVDGLTVALPTNVQPGRLDGSEPRIAGGGNLQMDVRGSIYGGNYLLGRGTAEIVTGGTIGSRGTGLAPVLQIADARVALSARLGVQLASVFNPTVVEPDPSQGLPDIFFFPQPTYAFSYSDFSGLAIDSLAGDILLTADPSAVVASAPDRFFASRDLLAVYPGSLQVRSFEGDIAIAGRVALFPASRGALEILAAQDVTAASEIAEFLQSDADVDLLPSIRNPFAVISDQQLGRLLLSHAVVPVHATDTEPARIVAQRGDVGTDGTRRLSFSLAKQTRVDAAVDILNLGLAVQHNQPNDVTVVQAGRDIAYRAGRRPDGRLIESTASIDIAGPGSLTLIAARDVDFGTSSGVRTRGDISNPALPDGGADISIWAGQSLEPAFDTFITKYLQQQDTYSEALADYLDRFPPDDALSDVERFRALSRVDQREFIIDVFFGELRESGISASAGTGSFDRGFAAIETLFPTDAIALNAPAATGDVRSFLSQITTLDGGDINMLVPRGLVNSGVASSGSLTKPPDRLGVIVQRAGNVNAFVQSDFLVNSARVFALDGGDILVWSSEGDIDAGRGARAALAIPPPLVTFDAQGNTVVEFPPAVAGSGIRTAVSTAGRLPGDVYLFAPEGVVDAGDAGIASAGNITVVAEQVIGADNITFGGAAVGVPSDTGGLGASLAGVSAASSAATNAAVTEVEEGDVEDSSPLAAAAVGWLEVFVTGFGEENCRPEDTECLRRAREGQP